MDYLIKSESAVLGFCIQKYYIDFLCKKMLYKINKESGKIVCKKEIFEKEGSARIITADEKQIYISDFCTLYVLGREDYEIIGKWKIGQDLSSDICGMTVDEKRIYCSIRNGRIITVDKSSFGKHEYVISDASTQIDIFYVFAFKIINYFASFQTDFLNHLNLLRATVITFSIILSIVLKSISKPISFSSL